MCTLPNHYRGFIQRALPHSIFLYFFLTRQATIELSRAPVKGEMYNKNYLYTYLRVHERRKAENRSV